MSFANTRLGLPKILARLAAVPKKWDQLARAVQQQRTLLGLSYDAIHDAGGPSDMVLSRIERNHEPHPKDNTVNKLDTPLQWAPGTAQRILAGLPVEDSAATSVSDIRDIPIDDLLGEIRRRVVGDESQNYSWRPGWGDGSSVEGAGVSGDEQRRKRSQLNVHQI
jgi:hypothetical protein